MQATEFPITLNAIQQEAKESRYSRQPLTEEQIKQYIDRDTTRFEKALENLDKGLAAKEIYNPDFEDLKYVFSRTFEKTCHAFRAKYFHAGKYQQLPHEVQEIDGKIGLMSFSYIPGYLKKLEKFKSVNHPLVSDQVAMLNEWLPIHQAMAALKPYVIKGRKPNPNAVPKNVFVPPKTSSAALKLVNELLVKITQDVYDKLLDGYKDYMWKVTKRFLEANKAGVKEASSPYRYFQLEGLAAMVVSDTTVEQKGTTKNEYVLKDNAETIIEKMAVREAKSIQDQFVDKNTDKLAPIIAAKDNLKDATIRASSGGFNRIEGTIHFDFKDGSQFDVDNKVVLSYSVHNRPFYRFPTTFHNVVMPDGNKMGTPSEERMNKVFTDTSKVMKPS